MILNLKPKVLLWARERAGLDAAALAKKVGGGVTEERVEEWEQTGKLTFTQAKRLSHVTHTPEGFLYLAVPPEDKLPIPDFRTVGDALVRRPSPDLLDTVYIMQRRQAWMRDFLIEEGEPPLLFVGSATLNTLAEQVAADIRKTLGCADGWANEEDTWTEALTHLRQKIEAADILIVINGVVGNNSYRKLDPEEFRGFVLCDAYAPLIFINGADFKAAQMFTFAHELAHLWLGQDGVSNFEALQPPPDRVEQWCNAVAAEFLVPAGELKECWPAAQRAEEPYQFLAARFKVSSLVAARRALDLGLASRTEFFDFYRGYQEDERRKQARPSTGGNFWSNQNVRVGQRFGAAVVRAAKEGRLLYREAYQLTGLSGSTFDRFAETLGFRMG
jgi:Zn-dependent peptidase ImmA (M78 family)